MACAATETSWRFEISDIEKRKYYTNKAVNNKDADQTAQMRRLICIFVVRIWQKQVFSYDVAHFILIFL